MGYLMRRNIQTFKAFEGNSDYDLLCVNADRPQLHKALRVQVKSRIARDCDCGFLLKCVDEKIDYSGFDFLVAVRLNAVDQGDGVYRGFADANAPELYVIPVSDIKQNQERWISGRRLVLSHKRFEKDAAKYKGDTGISLIVKALQEVQK